MNFKCSLTVLFSIAEYMYLALEDGSPFFRQIEPSYFVLFLINIILQGFIPSMIYIIFIFKHILFNLAYPISLAATLRVSFDFFSYSYYDVSFQNVF